MTAATAPQPFNQRRRIWVLRIAAAAAAALALLSQPRLDAPTTHELIEWTGFVCLLTCVFGRLWSILYIGGVKNRELTVTGPYSLSRNPLYVFSTLGAFGFGLAIGSLVYAFGFAAVVGLVLRATALKEAAYLRTQFPLASARYEAEVPLFWPKFSGYQAGGQAMFSPPVLQRTFRDALAFLALLPIIEILEGLQASGAPPTLLRIW